MAYPIQPTFNAQGHSFLSFPTVPQVHAKSKLVDYPMPYVSPISAAVQKPYQILAICNVTLFGGAPGFEPTGKYIIALFYPFEKPYQAICALVDRFLPRIPICSQFESMYHSILLMVKPVCVRP